MLDETSDFSPGRDQSNCPENASKHENAPSVVLTNSKDLKENKTIFMNNFFPETNSNLN